MAELDGFLGVQMDKIGLVILVIYSNQMQTVLHQNTKTFNMSERKSLNIHAYKRTITFIWICIG